MSCWNAFLIFLIVEVLELTFCTGLHNVFKIGVFPHLVSVKPLPHKLEKNNKNKQPFVLR